MSEDELSQTALSEAFERTAEVLAPCGASYALIGGFAVAFHGIPRPTRDIDILCAFPQVSLPGILEKFLARGFTLQPQDVIRELREDHLSRVHYRRVRVDLLDAVVPVFKRTVERAREEEIRGRRVRVASPEDLIALKIIAGRDDDLRDVRGILATQGGRLDLAEVRRSLKECCDQGRIDGFERLVREARG